MLRNAWWAKVGFDAESNTEIADGCARVIELLGTQKMKDEVYSRLTR